MIPEIGNFALIVALTLALVQGSLPLIGAHYGNANLMAVARPSAQGQFAFVLIAFGCLVYSFLINDFSVENVARNSSSNMPEIYRFTATWGSHEGSLLLWVLIQALWAVAVSIWSRRLPAEMAARVIGVLGLVSTGFLGFLLATSNPFVRLVPAAIEGKDLNPLLQDFGMVLHPPMLYMGYVGFSVAFAFAIAALLSGKLDAAWARWSRPWTVIAWLFLAGGVGLGSWWAYRELGWGGWWFWDPTENASLMPLLAGTALIHSLAVTDKRGAFKGWTVLLAILTFSLSLLGTFLVRSGVLSSVHAFAVDPTRGAYIIGFLAVVVGGSLILYALRAPKLAGGGSFTLFSREALLLGSNVMLIAALGAVMLGTLYPLFMDAMGMGKVSVGPPYFNAVFVPLMVPALFLVGIGPLARWKKADLPDMVKRLRIALIVAVVSALILPLTIDGFNLMVSIGLALALWIVFTVFIGFAERLKHTRGNKLTALLRLPLGFWGMQLAHFGLAWVVAGITVVSGYESERYVKMNVDDTVSIVGYTLTFKGVDIYEGPNFQGARGILNVVRDDGKQFVLHPEKRIYNISGMVMTEAGLHTSFTRDLYTALGDELEPNVWTLMLYHKPLISWLWIGCLFMVMGGVLAASDRRYRIKAEKTVRKKVANEGALVQGQGAEA